MDPSTSNLQPKSAQTYISVSGVCGTAARIHFVFCLWLLSHTTAKSHSSETQGLESLHTHCPISAVDDGRPVHVTHFLSWPFASLSSSLPHAPTAVYTMALGFTWNEFISAFCHISKLPHPTVQYPFSFLPPSSCCALTSLTESARPSASGDSQVYPLS